MDMDVARTPKLRIFEVMMLEIGNRVRHIRLARKERLFPDRLTVANDAAGPADVIRQRAEQQFGTKCRIAKFGMCQPQIIAALGHMIRKLVGESKA